MTAGDTAPWWRRRGDTLELDLRIQPKASRDLFAGPLGERYKITITAPPIDGKANKHLCRYLAKAFGVPASRVSVIKGLSGREKRVQITAPQQIPAPLTKFISP